MNITRPARTRAQRAAGLLLDACRSREPAMMLNFPNPTRSFDEMRTQFVSSAMTAYSRYGSSSRLAHLPTAERRGAECLKRNAYRPSTGCAAPSMSCARGLFQYTTSIPTRCPRLISAGRIPTEIEWNLEAKHCLGTGAAVASVGGHWKARPEKEAAQRPRAVRRLKREGPPARAGRQWQDRPNAAGFRYSPPLRRRRGSECNLALAMQIIDERVE